MIKVAEVAFTAYPVTDMARARAFYENVLGLKPATVAGPTPEKQWVEYEIGPHTLSVSNMAPDWHPNPDGGCVGLEVEDFEQAISDLRAAGVNFRVEPFPTPVCKMAIITDPDGNSLIIHRRHDH